MSLPEDLLDELLSAHLDGVASSDERARVEQMLCDDPAVRQQFDRLKELRAAFRSAGISPAKLPSDFADQVVRAAIAQAQSDRLPADHPLQLAARSKSVTSPAKTSEKTIAPNPGRWLWVAGLAAAVLLAGFAADQWIPDGEDPDSDHSIVASNRPTDDRDLTAGPLLTDSLPVESIPERPLPVDSPEAAMAIAVRNNHSAETIAAEVEIPKTALPETMADVDTELSQAPMNHSPSLVSSDAPDLPHGAVPPLQALLVVEVRLSALGHSTDAFGQSLRLMGIEPNAQRHVNVQMAQAIDQNSDPTNPKTPPQRVLLLETSAKKLDRLVIHLFSDRSAIEGIAFSLMSAQLDGPLLNEIDSARRVDPTQIRHQDIVTSFSGNSAAESDALVRQVRNRAFAPLNGPQDAQLMFAMQAVDNGPDLIMNILFLVR